jgi:hypothetical protein
MCGILGGFFFSALLCHQALARKRPSADRLTEFYFFVSLGGVLGGAFAAFVAPVIFNNVYEFPLAMAAACLFRPRAKSNMPRLTDASVAAAVLMSVSALLLMAQIGIDSIVVVLGALGAAALMVAAGWGDDSKPPAYRYSLLGVAALHAVLVIWVAFHIETIFTHVGEGEARHFVVQQPWGVLLLITSFLALSFAVHGTVQPKRDNSVLADLGMGAAVPSLVLLMLLVLSGDSIKAATLIVLTIGFCGIAVFLNRGRPIVLAAIVLLAFAVIFLDDVRGGRVITQERSFFGVLRTRVIDTPSAPPLRILMHGTTIHGAQIAAPEYERMPLTYYHPRTALGEAIVAGLSSGEHSRLALIGLGTGSTACLMAAADNLTIFEIDPAVVRLAARPGGDFTFVPTCQPDARVVLGDARLGIAHEPDKSFDVIVVDAFSSDAIPAHLLTKEALELYLSKLSDRGIVILHLSNRNLALVSEAARVARDLHAPTLFRISERFDQPPVSLYGGLAASVMIVARTPEALAGIPLTSNGWRVFEAPPGRGWTDDYINLPRSLWEGLNGAEECRLYGGPNCPAPPASAPPTRPADPTSQ